MLSSEIRFFLVVASCGSLRAASEQLFVAVSAISRQIQRLEAQVGIPLFERHARGMQLTKAGQIFESRVRKSMQNIEDAIAEIRGQKSAQELALRIGCTNGMAFMLMPQLLAQFGDEHPGISFILTVADSKTLARQIRNGDCDLIFQFSLHPERNVEVAMFWPAPVLLLMHNEHPLADKHISLADLCQFPVCLPEPGSTIRQLFDISCQMHGIFIDPTLTSDSFSTLCNFVLNKASAVTICSQFTAMPLLHSHNMTLKSLSVGQLNQRTLQLHLPPERQKNLALDTFVNFIKKQISEKNKIIRETFSV